MVTHSEARCKVEFGKQKWIILWVFLFANHLAHLSVLIFTFQPCAVKHLAKHWPSQHLHCRNLTLGIWHPKIPASEAGNALVHQIVVAFWNLVRIPDMYVHRHCIWPRDCGSGFLSFANTTLSSRLKINPLEVDHVDYLWRASPVSPFTSKSKTLLVFFL